MKKILFALFILISVIGYSQPTTITGYTTVNNKYNWLAITTRALNIPAGTTPALATGQWVGFGGLYADSTGGNKGIHYWNGTAWVRLVDTTYTGLASSNTSIGTGFPIAWDGTNQIRKLAATNGMLLDTSISNTITVNLGETSLANANNNPFTSDRYIQAGGASVYKLDMIRDLVSFGAPYSTDFRYTHTEFTRPSVINLKSVDGGTFNFTIFDSSNVVGSSFPGIYFYKGYNQTLLGGMIYHFASGDNHFDIFDARGSTTYVDIQFNGNSTIDWRTTGETYMGLIGSKRVGIGKGLGALGANLDVVGSFRNSDSTIHSNISRLTDTTGFDIAVLDRSTGNMKKIYPGLLGGGASGITIGSTTITGGSSPNILYHTTEGFVGEYSVTGSGSTAVLSTTPTFTTSIIDTLVIGSTSANGRLVLTGNNNAAGNTGTLVNTTIAVGNSSGTPALRAYNSAIVTLNGATYDANHELIVKSQDNTIFHGIKVLPLNESTALSIGYNGISNPGVLTVEGLGGINIQGASSAVYGKMTSAGLWNIGGSNTGTSSLTVQGTFAPTLATSAIDVTLGAQTTMVLTATGKTATLPTAVGCQGRIYIIKLSASGSGTVATTSSQTIDGATTYSLASQYKYVAVQSDNANWHVIANN